MYKIRRLLTMGAENLRQKTVDKIDAKFTAGAPDREVTVTWDYCQSLRRVYQAPTPQEGGARFEALVDKFSSCAVLEVKRLLTTLQKRREEILAYFSTGGASNGPVEAVNNLIEKTR